ncbi:MAG: hypothetical protein QM692_21245 [Thermomicrobiales bacterium]
MTSEQVLDVTCASVVEVAAGPLVTAALARLDTDDADVVEPLIDRFVAMLRGELIDAVTMGVSGE